MSLYHPSPKKKMTTGSWMVLAIILLGLSLATVGLVGEDHIFSAHPGARVPPIPANTPGAPRANY